jgi:hypothetical protein
MAPDTDARKVELERNYGEFEKLLPKFRPHEMGKFALMRDGKLINIFDSAKDAVLFADAQFKDDMYSVQHINPKPADLGYFSHAVSISSIRP